MFLIKNLFLYLLFNLLLKLHIILMKKPNILL